MAIRHFIRCYEFLVQATCFEDVDIHKKYKFLSYLQTYLKVRHSGGGFDLTGKIKADNFVQKKSGEFAYFDNIDDALVEGLEQNQDFFSLLLDNDEIKRQVLGIFASDVYTELKGKANVLYPKFNENAVTLKVAEDEEKYGKK